MIVIFTDATPTDGILSNLTLNLYGGYGDTHIDTIAAFETILYLLDKGVTYEWLYNDTLGIPPHHVFLLGIHPHLGDEDEDFYAIVFFASVNLDSSVTDATWLSFTFLVKV